MITLALLFYQWTRANHTYKVTVFLVALLFAWLGDVFLLFDSKFLFGLGAFLMMQMIYTSLFFQEPNYFGRRELLYGTSLIVAIASTLYFIGSTLGSLYLPVLIYSSAIGLMSLAAFSRDQRGAGYRLVYLGTLLFIVSDAVLAINQFADSIPFGGIIVMSTYLTAQYLISYGYASYLQK